MVTDKHGEPREGSAVRIVPRRNYSTGSTGEEPLQGLERRGKVNLIVRGDGGEVGRTPMANRGQKSDMAGQEGGKSDEVPVGARGRVFLRVYGMRACSLALD